MMGEPELNQIPSAPENINGRAQRRKDFQAEFGHIWRQSKPICFVTERGKAVYERP